MSSFRVSAGLRQNAFDLENGRLRLRTRQTRALGTLTHISQEILEFLPPPATTVVACARPRSIGWRVGVSVGSVLLRLLNRFHLASDALGGTSCSQVTCVVFANATAIASTNPDGLPVAPTSESDDRQLAEFRVEQVNTNGRWNLSIVGRHAPTPVSQQFVLQNCYRPLLAYRGLRAPQSTNSLPFQWMPTNAMCMSVVVPGSRGNSLTKIRLRSCSSAGILLMAATRT